METPRLSVSVSHRLRESTFKAEWLTPVWDEVFDDFGHRDDPH